MTARSPVDRFIAPRVEAEIGVILGSETCPARTALPPMRCRAARGLVAAVEIVDSRIRDWKIKLADTVADLASNGAIALSSAGDSGRGVDPRLLGMVVTQERRSHGDRRRSGGAG